MPIYEYRCDDCHERFEMRRSYADSDMPTICPSCHGQHTHRMLSNFVAFTASGDGGAPTPVAGGGGCAGCAGGSCATCGR